MHLHIHTVVSGPFLKSVHNSGCRWRRWLPYMEGSCKHIV